MKNIHKSISKEQMMAEIETFHSTDMEAAKAKDIKTLLGLWTEDCILLAPGIDPIIGKDAMWQYLQAQNAASRDVEIIDYVQDFKEVQIVGEMAFEWCVFYGASRTTDGEIFRTKAKLFRILKRTGESEWKCARSIFHVDGIDKDSKAK